MAHWFERHRKEVTFGQWLADKVASSMGSWTFLIIQSLILAFWVSANVLQFVEHWDGYPFVFLNLILSFQAAYAAPIIMISQNRQSERDRHHAEEDYRVNREAEKRIEALQQQLALIEISKLDLILKQLGIDHGQGIPNQQSVQQEPGEASSETWGTARGTDSGC